MPIKGLTEPRKIPRLGKIRLGIKVKRGNVEYPKEVDYFVLDPDTPIETEREKYLTEFTRIYGEQPKCIDVMLPTSNMAMNLVCDYKRYGSNGLLQCKGDGETAVCTKEEYAQGLKVLGTTEEGMIKVECLGDSGCPHYDKKKCAKVGVLNIMLPKLPGIGVWQIVTHSVISIQNLIDVMATNLELFKRIHLLPATLERRAVKTERDGKADTHYCLFLDFKGSLADVQRLAQGDPTSVFLQLPQPDPKEINLSSAIEIKGDGAGINSEEISSVPENNLAMDDVITQVQIKELRDLYKSNGYSTDTWNELLIKKFEKSDIATFTNNEVSDLLNYLRSEQKADK